MPISSALAARLGSGPAPARWSPYARPSEPRGPGGVKACRPPLRLDPPTARLLGPVRKAAASRPSFRAEAAGPRVAPPTQRRRGDDKPNPKPAKRDEEPPVDEGCGGGDFAFQCALAGHTEAISGISLPLGSDRLYSGSIDGTVRVWDCNTGKCVDVIKMGGKVGCMITHGPWVFVGIPKSIEVWNTQTGTKISLQGPSGLVCSMTIKNEMLFAGTGDGRIMAWNFPANENNFEPVAILSGHERPVISLSVSATRLYSSSLDKTIKVWDLKSLRCVQTLSEHKAAVTSVLCWDQKLLSCSLDKTVKVWAASKSGNLQVIYTHAEDHLSITAIDLVMEFTRVQLVPPIVFPAKLIFLVLRMGLRTLFGMHRVGKTPVLFCSLHKSNSVRLLELPSFNEMGELSFRFNEMGELSSKKEVRTIELAAGGLLFTGDCAGELKVWRWAPLDQELPGTPARPEASQLRNA